MDGERRPAICRANFKSVGCQRWCIAAMIGVFSRVTNVYVLLRLRMMGMYG